MLIPPGLTSGLKFPKRAAVFSQILLNLSSRCCAEVNLSCFDRSVVTLLGRASVTPPSFLSISSLNQCFSLYLRIASYCEYVFLT